MLKTSEIEGERVHQHVHYEAPPAERLDGEMARLLDWINAPVPPQEPALLRAGLGHLWFVTLHPMDDGNGRMARALDQAQHTLDAVLHKAKVWQGLAGQPLNARQTKVLNRLLDGFEGKLTTAKWAALAKCSPDTALRDIQELVARGVLLKSDAGGRSSSYVLPGMAPEREKRS